MNHGAKEYARGDVTTNLIDGAFSVLKRGMKGVYQHCAEKHLHRYLVEFTFRYNNRIALGVDDVTRGDNALEGIAGKRLTYGLIDQASHAQAASSQVPPQARRQKEEILAPVTIDFILEGKPGAPSRLHASVHYAGKEAQLALDMPDALFPREPGAEAYRRAILELADAIDEWARSTQA